MGRGFLVKSVCCFLWVPFCLLTSGFSAAVAKETSRPLGDMTSRGEVKFEVREGIWKNVDPSYFPVFQGMRVKTEKGAAVISLANRTQIEMKTNTLLSFEQKDQLRVSQGQIEFRLSPGEALTFKVGSVVILRSPAMQADARPLAGAAKVEDIHGSIQVHSNGALTVKTNQGKLNILNQEKKVLAAVAAKESLTLPAPLLDKPVGKAPEIRVAQAGETVAAGEGTKVLGLSGWTWGIGAAVVGVAGIAAVASGGGGGGGGGSSCP